MSLRRHGQVTLDYFVVGEFASSIIKDWLMLMVGDILQTNQETYFHTISNLYHV